MTPREKKDPVKVIAITERQMHILKLTQAGVSQSEIARLLGVSRQAVQKVVQGLREKGLVDEKES